MAYSSDDVMKFNELLMYINITATDEILDKIAAEVNEIPEFETQKANREDIRGALEFAAMGLLAYDLEAMQVAAERLKDVDIGKVIKEALGEALPKLFKPKTSIN